MFSEYIFGHGGEIALYLVSALGVVFLVVLGCICYLKTRSTHWDFYLPRYGFSSHSVMRYHRRGRLGVEARVESMEKNRDYAIEMNDLPMGTEDETEGVPDSFLSAEAPIHQASYFT